MPENSDPTADADLERQLLVARRLLWEGLEAPRRGPRPGLTLTAIALAAIEVADQDGLSVLTMQRVANAVGVTKMALYRYVPGKRELVGLMTEAVFADVPRLAAVSGGWRPRLWEWAHQLSDRFSQHPWLTETVVGIRVVGPHELEWMEEALAALTETGLDGGETLDVLATLSGHVRAIAEQAAAIRDMSPEHAMNASIAAVLRGHEDRFPALTAALDPTTRHHPENAALDFGIACVLDGIDTRRTKQPDPN